MGCQYGNKSVSMVCLLCLSPNEWGIYEEQGKGAEVEKRGEEVRKEKKIQGKDGD